MRPLIIGPAELEKINAAIKLARQKPLPLAEVMACSVALPDTGSLSLTDRPNVKRSIMPEQVLFEHGYRAALSFEEQPTGLFRHLSVSVDTPGRLPSPEAVMMLSEAFGFRQPFLTQCIWWLEEFEAGHQAINVTQGEPPDAASTVP